MQRGKTQYIMFQPVKTRVHKKHTVCPTYLDIEQLGIFVRYQCATLNVTLSDT